MGLGSSKKLKCLVIGLDNSGKSTVVNFLKPNKVEEVLPTVGFSIEKFRLEALKNVKCKIFDMSGSGAYRNLWEHYYEECNGIVFVIDSGDRKRLTSVKEEIRQMLSHEEMGKNNCPILFLANKKDVKEARTPSELRSLLKLDAKTMKERPYQIMATNALTGEGIIDGMAWLTDRLK
mmetsp:Transcript_6695/g.11063  ORF Transcript_6695/g.11063 Transcript_6695/m.11063 type:complete len:177 (+) Transcript_6695:227-757(+)|eukprot:jgi/Bigna1/55693/estExt_Genewise1Plus.C_670078